MDDTKFYVQIGKGKSKYWTKYSFTGIEKEKEAWFWYGGINVGYGYKKRLVREDIIGKIILARQFS